MKNLLIVFVVASIAVFFGCTSTQSIEKTDHEFGGFGFDGVKGVGNVWMVTGIGGSRDMQFASTIAEMNARTELINFLAKPTLKKNDSKNLTSMEEKREYTLYGSMVTERRVKRTDNGWSVKIIMTAPKSENPKE